MDLFNLIICRLFDLITTPFATLHPYWGLITISILTGFIMLLIFRFTSDQEGIQEVKNRIKAHIFEIRLFNDDLKLMLEAQKNILKANLTYMKYSLKPMIFLIFPVVLIMIQLSLRFSQHPLTIGESAIVKVKFQDQASFNKNLILKAPEGIKIETPPLRILGKKEVDWRIKALKKGTYDLGIEVGKMTFSKSLKVSDQLLRLSTRRVSANILQQFLYPGERSLPSESGIEYIEIKYPTITYHIFGWHVHWLVIFFAVSILTGFMLKGLFKVEI